MIVKTTPVPWPVFDEPKLRENLHKAFIDKAPGSKHKGQLYQYAIAYDEPALALGLLRDAGYPQARAFTQAGAVQARRHYMPYFAHNLKDILRQCDKHGVEHRTPMNLTPLMAAAAAGNLPLVEALLERGADPEAADHTGRNALHWLNRHRIARASLCGQVAAGHLAAGGAGLHRCAGRCPPGAHRTTSIRVPVDADDVRTAAQLLRVARRQRQGRIPRARCWKLLPSCPMPS